MHAGQVEYVLYELNQNYEWKLAGGSCRKRYKFDKENIRNSTEGR